MKISQNVLDTAERIMPRLAGRFAEIDAVSLANTEKILDAFQAERVSEAHFAGSTGYGYDDLGRDTLDKIYARVFHA